MNKTDPRGPAMLAALRLTVRGGLAGVWVRGRLPAGPAVWAANHHSWWDPFIAGELIAGAGSRMVLLADVANMRRYRFARHVGVVSAGELRHALAAVGSGAVLVIYPEGRLLPAGAPAPLAPGAAWAAARAPARLCSVAVRVTMRGGQYPEAYVVFSEVDAAEPVAEVTERLRERLGEDLRDVDRLSTDADPRQPLPGFTRVMRGRRSWDERVDAARGLLPWPRR
ncbi:MAG TPA: 1-acyl-sn-glycerol-3-phosphate acyltransferase [Streptosporangiaceae bacterium]|nr:1-acyl-sn-glycerol-3-phosphate acyltransferase [Streptosporangiaceae bacterium]